ncbi:MAG: putative Ig domain-containing protein [Sediminibacterium sp.]|uniref:putative Ig domain-containing protein n=1 Tax=Sediminibacterium sp. TaxID=1917865 RepID=UPI00271B6AB4|nr:putative Ig domain-containing protein [Sediminibacterium sp.]MDO8996438.1 putative Ig domain-containing protein [Sediminibacterium sp.]
MKKMLHTISSSGFRNVRTVLLLTMLLFAGVAQAAHFRSGTISWRPISGNTVEFKVSQSYGGWAFGSGYTLGSTQIMDYLYTGNGYASVPIPLVITSINAAEGWWYGEATFQYTYPSAGNYAAYFSSCCRISDLSNNSNQQWRNETIVNVGNGNSSPVSTIAATVNLPQGLSAAQFQIPAFDPDGDALSYRLATSAEMGGGTNPSGLSINATTGLVSFNTVGKAIGSLWNVAFTISDGAGKTKVTVDFIIKITQNSTPPIFDYLITPANSTVIQASPGQPVNFSVRAYDNDQGNIVTLSAVGLPPGATSSPSLPTNGNPVTTNFSWTPAANQFGSFVINFTATDNIGVQSTSSVTIQLSLKPLFNVPPTPAANSETYLETGVAHQSTITASDPDPNDIVQIMSVTGLPAGATLSSSLPTVAANPTSVQLNWTPTPANFGIHTISFVAKDSYNDQTTHSFKYLVNTKPVFSSTPSLVAYVGQTYTYTITGVDPDMAYGDVLKLIGGIIPSWLTFTNNGNGTGSLSGTPSLSDLGDHSVSLKLEDTYHHDYSPITTQNFTVNVSGRLPLIVSPGNQTAVVAAGTCGAVVNFTATDSEGIPASTITYSIAPGSVFPVGTTTVTATATNIVGSSQTSFTVTVNDNELPTVNVNNVSVTLVNGTASVTAADINNNSTDNCGIQSIVLSGKTNYTCADLGTHTVTLTVTDIHGNVQTATAVVTVVGQLPSSSIVSQPTSSVYTGGNANNIYLGYGAQSTVLKVNATGGSAYTYQWIGAASNMLSSTTSGMPVFTPTVAGTYTFTVVVTNNFGCTTTSKITICVKDIRVPGSKGAGKVYVCHMPPGNNQNPQTLEISVNAVAAHLTGHSGDRLGSCATAACVESTPTVGATNTNNFSKAEEVVADDLKVTVMPNPSTTYFTLKLVSQSNLPVNIKVVDAAGRLVEGRAKQPANSTLQFGHNYAIGNYYAELMQGNQRKVVQLIKIK